MAVTSYHGAKYGMNNPSSPAQARELLRGSMPKSWRPQSMISHISRSGYRFQSLNPKYDICAEKKTSDEPEIPEGSCSDACENKLLRRSRINGILNSSYSYDTKDRSREISMVYPTEITKFRRAHRKGPCREPTPRQVHSVHY